MKPELNLPLSRLGLFLEHFDSKSRISKSLEKQFAAPRNLIQSEAEFFFRNLKLRVSKLIFSNSPIMKVNLAGPMRERQSCESR